ncbi:hypothetical protein BZG36_00260 [Bifiguratus adelaidae]|uniref:26S proteasome regulatory subunit RPN3 n=1 Tax=Bifiguratus adelaidae TaxID=1938954 RepID=A0A261Y8Q8_9FUNG|nr:hypothetical protein BZG36_00260 [Bifiguratus adelaidae]
MAESSKEKPTTDVEMKETTEGAEKEEQVTEVDPVEQLKADIKQNILLLEKGVNTVEARYTTRVLRTTASIRRRLTPEVLATVIRDYYPESYASKSSLLSYLDVTEDSMAVDTADKSSKSAITVLPEADVYLHMLVMVLLLDKKDYRKGIKSAEETVELVRSLNRRTLDQLTARVYFYYARFYELTDRLGEIRPLLLQLHRTATLRHDDDTQATLLNLLLRNYFHYNLYEAADKLVSKTAFPPNAANNQLARYLYYMGRIKALQLDYSAAHADLQAAIRKAPQNTASAGFQQTVYKFFIIVQLLMGDIPERSIFRQPVLRKALVPYLEITQAVRVGDLAKFQEVLSKYDNVVKADKTYTLILRLRHNVIKAGIRRLSISYSRIPLKEICLKLHLDSEEDAEFIVAKAIRDGVIDATLDHDRGFMKSTENTDIYSTNEPQDAFHQRINFCLELHNASVKAMRFPLNAHRKELANAQEALERERELVKEIAEGDLDDMDEDGGDMGDF